MSDRDLFEHDTSLMAQQLPVVAEPKGSALVESSRSEAPSSPPDMRAALMTLPRDQQTALMTEYVDRRRSFRDLLREQLKEGVHFGYPPGIKPRFDNDGNMLVRSKDKDGNWKETTVHKTAWTAKPSLYKAGADFVCDLLLVRDEYEADMAAWEQMGKPKDTFVMACRLYSRSNGELLGEGRGVRSVGQKGGDANNAIKMAKKCAKVDAVLNAYGLSDLFTQDIEDDAPPRADEAPPTARDKTKPKVPPRGQRQQAPGFDMRALCERWCKFHECKFDASQFVAWMENQLSAKDAFDAKNPTQWPSAITAEQFDYLMSLIP